MTTVLGIRRPGQQSIKKMDVHVGVEYQKNALRSPLMRFKACLGIKPLDAHQINFKRFPVTRDDKKEAS